MGWESEFIIIVGLRAIDPLPVGLGADCLPGYLSEVTERHRRGFQLPEIGNGWYAFVTNPLNAKKFAIKSNAMPFIDALIKNDKGRFRPLSLVTIFE
jgi:hypothetical protein